MKSLFGPIINEIMVDVEGEEMPVGVLYDGNPCICIQCGDFGHYHGNCDDEPGTGRAWSRFIHGDLPYELTTNHRLQQWRTERQRQHESGQHSRNHDISHAEGYRGESAATEAQQVVNLQTLRVQATINPNLEDVGMSELWEGLTVNDDVDPTLDLPMPDSRLGGLTFEPSPTLYSSASDSSLRGLQAAGGTAWRMFVP